MKQNYRFGLLGCNIGYSLSQNVFERIFQLLGVNGSFESIDCDESAFDGALERLREVDGFSVTIPYKERIIAYLDDIDEKALKIGAVNSVAVSNGKLVGYNTDEAGFRYPLRDKIDEMGNVLIIGYGGAARAVVWGILHAYRNAQVFITGRDMDRVASFIVEFENRNKGWENRLQSVSLNETGDTRFDMIVNCTPVGNVNLPEQCPLPDSFNYAKIKLCYDLIYKPNPTTFLKRALSGGGDIINGLPMLVGQAIESFGLWNGINSDTNRLYSELKDFFNWENQGVKL